MLPIRWKATDAATRTIKVCMEHVLQHTFTEPVQVPRRNEGGLLYKPHPTPPPHLLSGDVSRVSGDHSRIKERVWEYRKAGEPQKILSMC